MGGCKGEIAADLKDDNKKDATSEGDNTNQGGTALAVDVGRLVVSVTLDISLNQQGHNPRQRLHLDKLGKNNIFLIQTSTGFPPKILPGLVTRPHLQSVQSKAETGNLVTASPALTLDRSSSGCLLQVLLLVWNFSTADI